jgi:hypothetical protein
MPCMWPLYTDDTTKSYDASLGIRILSDMGAWCMAHF